MTEERFFILDTPSEIEATSTDFLSVDAALGEGPLCPKCGGATGMLPWVGHFVIDLEFWGNTPGDMAWGGAAKLIVSGRLMRAFAEGMLTGFTGFERIKVRKVKRHSKGPKRIPPYYHARLVPSRAALDEKASGVIRDTDAVVCDECREGDETAYPLVQSVRLEAGSWAGEDVFEVRGLPGHLLVSSRFKRYSDEHELRNIQLVPAEEYSYDYRV